MAIDDLEMIALELKELTAEAADEAVIFKFSLISKDDSVVLAADVWLVSYPPALLRPNGGNPLMVKMEIKPIVWNTQLSWVGHVGLKISASQRILFVGM